MSSDRMQPRPEPEREVREVRADLVRDYGTDWGLTDEAIDEAIETARRQIGGLRKSRRAIAAKYLARRAGVPEALRVKPGESADLRRRRW